MKEHRYWVYIVASNSGTLYIGVTDNLTRRMVEHKNGEIEGSPASTIAAAWYISRAPTKF